jgi:hypothetical protein
MTSRELDLLREIAVLDEKKGRACEADPAETGGIQPDDAAQAEVRFPVVHASEPRHNKFVMLV